MGSGVSREVVFAGIPHPLSRGDCRRETVLGSDANGPCAWIGRAPRMVVAGGDPAFHWPFAAPSGVVASRAPRRVRRTLVDGACEAARSGNRSRRFLLWRGQATPGNRLIRPIRPPPPA